MSNFHPLEVVDRGSETQLQVGENVNLLFSALRINVRDFHLRSEIGVLQCEAPVTAFLLLLAFAGQCTCKTCQFVACKGKRRKLTLSYLAFFTSARKCSCRSIYFRLRPVASSLHLDPTLHNIAPPLGQCWSSST